MLKCWLYIAAIYSRILHLGETRTWVKPVSLFKNVFYVEMFL